VKSSKQETLLPKQYFDTTILAITKLLKGRSNILFEVYLKDTHLCNFGVNRKAAGFKLCDEMEEQNLTSKQQEIPYAMKIEYVCHFITPPQTQAQQAQTSPSTMTPQVPVPPLLTLLFIQSRD